MSINYFDFIEFHLNKSGDSIKNINVEAVYSMVHTLIKLREAKGSLFLAGNGGSSALVSHFATDIGVGNLKFGSHLKCMSLMDNTSVLTATANDHGYENSVGRQIDINGSDGDVLMLVSSSGNSQNLINGVIRAKAKNMLTCALIGFDGGKLLNMVDQYVIVNTAIGEYELVEDMHSIILHIMAKLLREPSINAT